MQTLSFFHNLAIFLFSEIVIYMANWSNSVYIYTPDKQIGLPLRGRPTANWTPLSATNFPSELNFFQDVRANSFLALKFTCHVMDRACVLSTKMNSDGADGYSYSFD